MKSMFVFLIVVLILAGLSIFAHVMFWPNSFSINERQSGSPIPNGPECRTESDFAAEKYRWLLRHTAQVYEKNGSHRSGEQNVIGFLTEICRAVSFPTDPAVFQELARRVSELIAGGYDDPMVRLWSGVMYFRAKVPENTEPLLTTAYD